MSLSAAAAEERRDQLARVFEAESKTTHRVLEAIPPGRLEFKPHERSMSMGEVAWHIVTTESMFVGAILSGVFGKEALPADVPKERPSSAADLAGTYGRLRAARLADLQRAPGEALAKELDFHGFLTQPAIEFMNLNIAHAIHHRGQLSVYLRLAGGQVPSIYGPSADENPFEKKA